MEAPIQAALGRVRAVVLTGRQIGKRNGGNRDGRLLLLGSVAVELLGRVDTLGGRVLTG